VFLSGQRMVWSANAAPESGNCALSCEVMGNSILQGTAISLKLRTCKFHREIFLRKISGRDGSRVSRRGLPGALVIYGLPVSLSLLCAGPDRIPDPTLIIAIDRHKPEGLQRMGDRNQHFSRPQHRSRISQEHQFTAGSSIEKVREKQQSAGNRNDLKPRSHLSAVRKAKYGRRGIGQLLPRRTCRAPAKFRLAKQAHGLFNDLNSMT
jgi:hypothetical protein